MQLKFFSRSPSHPELSSPTAKPSAAATPKKGNSPKPPLAAAKNASSLASKKKLSSPNAVFPSSHPSPMDVVSSQKTLTDLPTIVESPSTEFDATEDIPKKSITVKGSHSGSTIIDETEIIAEKFKSVSIDDDDTYLSVPPQKNLPPKESDTKKLAKQTSKRSIFKFLKSKSPSSTSIEKTKEKEKSKEAKVKKSVDPPQEPTKESKELKAAEERERRLKEVLAVMEGRKRLPKGMENYNFTHFIGDGTYGFVVTAVNELDQECAVKFIFKEKVPIASWICDDDIGLVPMEIYLLKSLNHPNIIKFLDCFEDDNYIIMVTELHGTSWDSTNPVLDPNTHPGLKSEPRRMRVGSEGKGDAHTLASLSSSQKEMLRQRTSCDLFECIDAHDYFPERVARHIFKQVASAVAYLHERGIVHRDLKDENIVIDQNYTVKLIDFGSAARIPTLAKDYFDKFLGTLDFAAPEIIDGYRYRGPEAEIWGLGVLLYIIVFRQVPFRSPDEIVEAKLEIPARASLGSCGETLLNLLTRMLHPDSYKRLTIEEVLNHPWLQGKPKMPIS